MNVINLAGDGPTAPLCKECGFNHSFEDMYKGNDGQWHCLRRPEATRAHFEYVQKRVNTVLIKLLPYPMLETGKKVFVTRTIENASIPAWRKYLIIWLLKSWDVINEGVLS